MPLYFVITTASHSFEFFAEWYSIATGYAFFDNIGYVLTETQIPKQILNSLILALLVALGKCFFAYITAFGLVFFRVKYSGVVFGFIPGDGHVTD